MVASDHSTDGRNNKLDTTGEQQLNTPEPVDISGFEFDGSLGGLIVPSDNPRNANTKNHISNASIITMTGEESSQYRFSMHGSKGDQPFELKLSPATSPANYNTSWQFEPYSETAMLSTEMSYLTPHQSPSGVASPGSSSGVSSGAEELETCVDFSKLVNEANDYSTSFTEEIEQLSESYYCKKEDLISIQDFTADGNPPILLEVLQEEDSNASDGTPPPSVSNGTVYDTRPSVATKFLSDADKDDEDYDYGLADAAARTSATLQNVSCKEDTLDLKTQTQLEHNYTIKLPPLVVDAGNPGHILTSSTTLVKEPALKPRDSTAILPPQQPKRPQPAVSMKRQLFQRTIKTEMATEDKLKLKMPTASAPIVAPVGILSTPELTNQVLELEAVDEILSAEDQFDLLKYIGSGTDYDVVPISPVEEKPSVIKAEPVQPESTICPNALSQLLSNPPTKRKRPVITLENLDELTSCTTAKKYRSSASSSTASSICGDSISEATSSTSANKKRRGRPPKATSLQLDPSCYQDLNEEDQRYREQRDKNNEASRKSRINRRDRELKLEHEANALNQQYEELKNDERELIRECAKWRRAVMRLALL